MQRRRKANGLLAFAVLLAVVLTGGYALQSAGYIDNPFDEMNFLANWATGGEERFSDALGAPADLPLLTPDAEASAPDFSLTSLNDSDGGLPPLDSLSDADMGELPSLDGGAFPEAPAFVWSEVGAVLYDVWFILAATTVFIVIQQLFKRTTQALRPALARNR